MNSLDSIINRTARWVASHVASPRSIEVYSYGLFQFISLILSTVAVVALSILLRHTVSSLPFILVFYTLRPFCGGFHANSYSLCFILTIISFIVYVITIMFLSHITRTITINTILVIISFMIIYNKAPIINPHHPLSPGYQARAKRLAISFSLVYSIASIIFSFIYIPVSLHITVAQGIVVLMMLIPIIRRR